MTQNQGIDYGMGKTNIDQSNGIHFGVIHHGDVGAAWYESAEADYGKPTCPKCGNEAIELDAQTTQLENGVLVEPIIPENMEEWEYAEHECADYACEHCEYVFGSESAYNDEPLAFFIDDREYKAHHSDDGDIFIEKAPYFTYAQFCSPCAPGAGYLMNPFVNEWENSGTEQSGVMPAEDYPQDYKYKAGCAGFPKVYCFGHDWYENGKAPYPVFSVETGEIVKPV